jgi:hypothetical protein
VKKIFERRHKYLLLILQYEKLDEEHKGLFNGIFNVAGAKGDAGKLNHLKGIVKTHFDSEEVRHEKKLGVFA